MKSRIHPIFLYFACTSLTLACERPTTKPSVSPAAAPRPAPSRTSPAPSLPITAWNAKALPPRLELARRFSIASYERFAARSLYIEGLAERIASATYSTKLHAIEIDAFVDDHYYREGELVFLAVDDRIATAFASRYYVDITYPTSKLHVDGFGGTEWGRSTLTINPGAKPGTRPLELAPVGRAPTTVPPGTVFYRKLADNDAVVLYFSPLDLGSLRRGGPGSMDMENPDRELELMLREATQILGQEFILLSRASFNALRDAVPQRDIATELLAAVSGQLFSMALGKYLFRPLFGAGSNFLAGQAQKQLGKQAGNLFAATFRDTVDGFEQRKYKIGRREVAARTLHGYRATNRSAALEPLQLPERREFSALPPHGPNSIGLTRRLKRGDMSVLGVMQAGGALADEVELIGVELPSPGTQERAVLDDYLRQVLQARDVQFVRFQGLAAPIARGIVFVPRERLVLNLELLRQGLARFDTRDPAVDSTFPELAVAAQTALREGTGFAARWRDDRRYGAALASRATEDSTWGGLGAATPVRARPTLRECKMFSEHLAVLMTRGQHGEAAENTRAVAEGMRADLIKQCLQSGTPEEIACATRARSIEALERCGGSRPKLRPGRPVRTRPAP